MAIGVCLCPFLQIGKLKASLFVGGRKSRATDSLPMELCLWGAGKREGLQSQEVLAHVLRRLHSHTQAARQTNPRQQQDRQDAHVAAFVHHSGSALHPSRIKSEEIFLRSASRSKSSNISTRDISSWIGRNQRIGTRCT